MKIIPVIILSQDFKEIDKSGLRGFEENWDLPRKQTLEISYPVTDIYDPKEVADHMFYILNAPEVVLNEEERAILKNFHSHSLSIGDVVKVDDTALICASQGWSTK